MRAGVHPKPIHPHSTEDDAFVVATEVTIEGTQALCLEFGKNGVDELHDVETAKAR